MAKLLKMGGFDVLESESELTCHDAVVWAKKANADSVGRFAGSCNISARIVATNTELTKEAPMLNKFLLITLFFSANILAGELPIPETKTVYGAGIALSANSVACHAVIPGKCKKGDEILTHNDYVTFFAGQPSIVTSVYYFAERDDKVVLEFVTKEDKFVQLTLRKILDSYGTVALQRRSAALNYSGNSLDERTDIYSFWKSFVDENCPTEGGCIPLYELLERLGTQKISHP